MNVLSAIFHALNALLTLYVFVCIVRLVSTWIPALPEGSFVMRVVRALADPWFSLFGRSGRLRAGNLDFSPMVAIGVLYVIGGVLNQLAELGRVRLGLVLASIVVVAWSALAFFASFFAILILARGLAYAFRWNSLHPAWRAVDALINPVVYRTNRLVYRDRIVNYLQGLATAFVILALFRVAGGFGVTALSGLLSRIPF
ncbi:MAG TPA: YggT family protein [Spirochaetales bacterium]|nr:YggT family protein [Spirochaetales bacterium]